MIIKIQATGRIAIRDENEFRSLKLVFDFPIGDYDEIQTKYSPAIAFISSNEAWIDFSMLLEQLDQTFDDAWKADLHRMIESVRKFGWVSEGGKVKVHVEWSADTSIVAVQKIQTA